jgi:hypothetical protein
MPHRVMRALHLIAWIERHTDYVETAILLAEYVAKTAMISHLPPETARKYTEILEHMGIRVGKVNNEALAKCAMGLALPAAKSVFDDGSTSLLTSLGDAISIAQAIFHRVNDVASTKPDAIKRESHTQMANFICANKAITAEDFEKAAISAYGKTAHWLAMAMPTIDLHKGAAAVGEQLERAYVDCNAWANSKIQKSKCHPDIKSIVHDKIITASMGLHSARTPVPAPIQPSGNADSQKTGTPRPVGTATDRPIQLAAQA